VLSGKSLNKQKRKIWECKKRYPHVYKRI